MERGDRIGLGIAAAGHVALFAILSLSIAGRPEMRLPRDPIAITLTDKVGLSATAPRPQSDAATAVAPEVAPEITPEQVAAKPAEASPKDAMQPRPSTQPSLRPARVSPPPPTKPQPPAQRSSAAQTETRQARAPRLGKDFLKGVTDRASTSKSQDAPAAVAGPAVQASLANEVRRQLKPHWQSPSGADSELLRTELEVRLAADGSLIGEPRLVGQTGVTASNRSQARLHVEQAIKAVRLAAPFRLPAEYHDTWKTIRPVFDKRLSS